MNRKKEYLNSYLLQSDTIRILNEMILKNPSQKNQYLKRIKICENKRYAIENSIEKMTDPRLRVILYEKYVCGRTLEEISLILNYSKRHIERLHIAALKLFEI
jgi:hypothetical protein